MALVKLETSQLRPPRSPIFEVKQSELDSLALLNTSYDIYCELYERFLMVFNRFKQKKNRKKILIVQTKESSDHLNLIEDIIKNHLLNTSDYQEKSFDVVSKTHYAYNEGEFVYTEPLDTDNPIGFCPIHATNWIEMPSLFGTVHQHGEQLKLSEGILQQLNGGYLVLTAGTLLSNPLMFIRLLKVLETGVFEWLSPDETKPYPIRIQSMPLDVKLLILAERDNIDNLLALEPYLQSMSCYTEIEPVLELTSHLDYNLWQSYINGISMRITNALIDDSLWYALHCFSTRFTGDQYELSLCPQFWTQTFYSLLAYIDKENTSSVSKAAFDEWQSEKQYCEGYLAQRIYTDFLKDQIYIDVEGKIVGQINGLAVLSYPGHPVEIGEPSRITCIVHLGDGEVNDIERKVELGGNIHAKGLLIMQAFLFSSLKLTQPFPLSASIVFEQSYSEVDGDSASLAELCALISAIADVPINQQIAITGSVDQFGQVQPIGGVNEKIEGFFAICLNRGLTKGQGVIIPESNIHHLSVNDEVLEAIEKGEFHLWTVNHVTEAIELLTSIKYCSEDDEMDLLTMMQQKILQSVDNETPEPWYRRIFNFSN
ncbi:S16 family serine protease [Thorsellia kenyensis]|uniref:endopeptidase La n=1 Tax=Thorsellia kenyensis TaxID=1549888 RepID=A0ABV6CES2_9GAMM